MTTADTPTTRDLEAIRRRVPTHYPAPWYVEHMEATGQNAERWIVCYPTDSQHAGLVAAVPDYGEDLAEFIAHARQDIPDLLARVTEVEERLDNAHNTLSSIEGIDEESFTTLESTVEAVVSAWGRVVESESNASDRIDRLTAELRKARAGADDPEYREAPQYFGEMEYRGAQPSKEDAPSAAVDLMAPLRASIERARQARGQEGKH